MMSVWKSSVSCNAQSSQHMFGKIVQCSVPKSVMHLYNFVLAQNIEQYNTRQNQIFALECSAVNIFYGIKCGNAPSRYTMTSLNLDLIKQIKSQLHYLSEKSQFEMSLKSFNASQPMGQRQRVRESGGMPSGENVFAVKAHMWRQILKPLFILITAYFNEFLWPIVNVTKLLL